MVRLTERPDFRQYELYIEVYQDESFEIPFGSDGFLSVQWSRNGSLQWGLSLPTEAQTHLGWGPVNETMWGATDSMNTPLHDKHLAKDGTTSDYLFHSSIRPSWENLGDAPWTDAHKLDPGEEVLLEYLISNDRPYKTEKRTVIPFLLSQEIEFYYYINVDVTIKLIDDPGTE